MMDELFCIGDDDYKPNVFYVIGLAENRLFYHDEMKDKCGVIYSDSIQFTMKFGHFTDAKIHIGGLIDEGLKEAENYKVFKVICEVRECS